MIQMGAKAWFFATIILIAGCDSDSEGLSSLESVELIDIARFIDGIDDAPRRVTVVRSNEQFQNEWNRISSEEIPVVEFSDSYVVIAEMGLQGSGRADIEISDVLSNEQYAEVQITITVAGNNCDVTAALNSPIHVVAFPRVARDVIISEVYDVGNEC